VRHCRAYGQKFKMGMAGMLALAVCIGAAFLVLANSHALGMSDKACETVADVLKWSIGGFGAITTAFIAAQSHCDARTNGATSTVANSKGN